MKLVTVEEYMIGTEDRVFFGHQNQEVSECMTASQPACAATADRADRSAGWYWQARGTSDCWGPFQTREDAIADYHVT